MNTYKTENEEWNNLPISPDEWDRVYYNIAEEDFDTTAPNTLRINKLMAGINTYLKQKSKV